MSKLAAKIVSVLLVWTILLSSFGTGFIQPAHAADEFDTLREKWKFMLTGVTGYNPSDLDIAGQLAAIASKAQSNWDTMAKAPENYLWSDLASATNSAHITSSYTRLKEMALAFASHGSSLYNNADLKNDIITGLEWMYANRYNESRYYGNWWDWEIGAPLALNDAVVLMYEHLTSAQITSYMDVVGYFQPTVTSTGANRIWECTVIALRGVIVKQGGTIATGLNGISRALTYVTSGDGFYRDGSFIQHNYYSYNGGYGKAMLSDLSKIVVLLDGSTWAVTDANLQNMYNWVYDAYEPLIYKGSMMEMTRGREISRSYQDGHKEFHIVKDTTPQLTLTLPVQ